MALPAVLMQLQEEAAHVPVASEFEGRDCLVNLLVVILPTSFKACVDVRKLRFSKLLIFANA
jgi:hypothetical protein